MEPIFEAVLAGRRSSIRDIPDGLEVVIPPGAASLEMDMNEVARWAVGILSIGSMGFVLHWISEAFSPRSHGDPRLGTVGFWVWVALVAAFTHFVLVRFNLLPPYELPIPEWTQWVVAVGCLLFWLATRAGILERPQWYENSQEDHEEAWATLVGAFVGLALLPTIEHTLR